MEKKKVFRTKMIIYPRMQYAIILANFLVFLLTSVLIILQFFNMTNYIKGIGTKINLTEGHPFFKFIDLQTSSFLTYYIIGVVVALIVSTGISIFLSHKMAGPIVRLKSYLTEVKEKKEITALKFRKNDFFEELPELVLGALKSVEEKK